MGLFDEITVGSRSGQTKALGASMAQYVVGSQVFLTPRPYSAEEYDRYLRNRLSLPGPASFQLAMHEGGYVVVRGNTLTAWEETADPDLLIFDNGGHLLPAPFVPPEGYLYPVEDKQTEDADVAQLLKDIFS